MISLFYQAWEKYRFFVTYERDEQDRLSQYLMSFLGLGTKGLENRQAVADESLLFYCGLFSLQPRSAAALEQVLADYFDVPVEIEQFVGAWRPLDPSNQCRMEGGVAYSDQLGIGRRRRRRDLGAAIPRAHPARPASGAAISVVPARRRRMGAAARDHDVFFRGRDRVRSGAGAEARRSAALRIAARTANRRRCLGWFSWIKSGPAFARDPGDTVLLLN